MQRAPGASQLCWQASSTAHTRRSFSFGEPRHLSNRARLGLCTLSRSAGTFQKVLRGVRTLSRTLDGLRSPWQIRLLCMYCMPDAMPSRTPISGRQRRPSPLRANSPFPIASRRLPPLQYSCSHVHTVSAKCMHVVAGSPLSMPEDIHLGAGVQGPHGAMYPVLCPSHDRLHSAQRPPGIKQTLQLQLRMSGRSCGHTWMR
jgi:hypothetical protein